MKRIITILVFLAVGLAAKAQWVTIPDTNFVNSLNSDGYGVALNGNLLDTTNILVTSATNMQCRNSNISNLSGIEYFNNLNYLDCSSNNLTVITNLPNSITTLLCDYNLLAQLPNLPHALQILSCDNNSIGSLPLNLPNSILVLSCSNNLITNISALPSQLLLLDCSHNLINSISGIPSLLQYLYCNNNNLTGISGFPSQLVTLKCSYNGITSIGNLPNSLDTLICSYNSITTITNLPNNLKLLNCNTNPLSCLPYLPLSLVDLNGFNTQIGCVPNYPPIALANSTISSYYPLCLSSNINSCFSCVSFDTITQIICNGSSYFFNGHNLNSAGLYSDTLPNYLGCDSVIALNLIVGPTITFTASSKSCFNPTNCISLSMNAANGTAPYSFNVSSLHGGIYNSGNKTICYSNPQQDTITVTVNDANGCIATATDTIKLSTDCVWPGDANSDLVADNLDIFPIGLLNGTTGPVRNNASLIWIDQPATPFGTTASGFTTDAKHADCNGDGIIDGNDTTAILQNYGLTHLRKKSGADLMSLTVGPDTLYQNTTATILIDLGTSANPLDSVYGVAFSFNVDPTAIDTNSINITAPASWLFNNATDHFQIYKLNKSATRVDVGLVRNNQISKSGYGTIVSVTIDITTGNIIGREDALAAYNKKYQLHCSVDNITILKLDGSMISANMAQDSSTILYNKPDGINLVSVQNLSTSIIPNPATNNVSIKLKGYNYNEEKKLILIDATGRLMLQKSFTSNQTTIDISELNQGIYIAKIISEKGITESKLIKQ